MSWILSIKTDINKNRLIQNQNLVEYFTMDDNMTDNNMTDDMADDMADDNQTQRQNELRERENQRRNKKRDKKRKKKNRKQTVKEIEAMITPLSRVLDRIKRVDDMNLRCYMLLDKFALMMDMGIAMAMAMATEDIPEEAEDKLNFQLENIQNEITVIMDWVMSERQIPNEELANPIPESGNNNSSDRAERRRRNRD